MTTKVLEAVSEMEAIKFPAYFFYTKVEQLLQDYPEFDYANVQRDNSEIYHDLEKKATPHGIKNSLKSDKSVLMPLVEEEQKHLMKVRNAMKKILAVVPAARNKKFILSILEHLFKMIFSTGGGTSPAVRRIIMIYEREGGIQGKKRKAGEEIDMFEDIPDIDESEAVLPVEVTAPVRLPTETELTVKKLKSVSYIITPAEEAPTHEWIRMFDIQPTDADVIAELDTDFAYEVDDLRAWTEIELSTLAMV